MTFNQARELGANVRKGERGSLVVFAIKLTMTEQNDASDAIEREIPYMKGYTVFNVGQIDNLPDSYRTKTEPLADAEPMQLIETAKAFFAKTGATVRHGGIQAYYAPAPDIGQLPLLEKYTMRKPMPRQKCMS